MVLESENYNFGCFDLWRTHHCNRYAFHRSALGTIFLFKSVIIAAITWPSIFKQFKLNVWLQNAFAAKLLVSLFTRFWKSPGTFFRLKLWVTDLKESFINDLTLWVWVYDYAPFHICSMTSCRSEGFVWRHLWATALNNTTVKLQQAKRMNAFPQYSNEVSNESLRSVR